MITLNDVDEIPPVISPLTGVSYQRSTPIVPIPLVATDNSGSVTLQVNGLPAGLTFDMTGSQIIGTTPATSGNYPIQVVAIDQAGNQTTVQFTLCWRLLLLVVVQVPLTVLVEQEQAYQKIIVLTVISHQAIMMVAVEMSENL